MAEQMAIKDKLSRIRKGTAAEPAPSPIAANDEASVVPQVADGASRFGGLKHVRVGDLSESDAGGVDDGYEDIPFDALPSTRIDTAAAPAPARAPGRFGALARPTQARAPSPAVRRAAPVDCPEINWKDPNRPPGSSYSEAEWRAAEDGGTNVVFEMIKPDEIGLVAIPRASMNAIEALLYARSIVVSEDVGNASQWPKNAEIIHRAPVLAEREVIRYRLVMCAAAIEANSWLLGSIMRNDLEVAFQESKATQADKSRFGNTPRPR